MKADESETKVLEELVQSINDHNELVIERHGCSLL